MARRAFDNSDFAPELSLPLAAGRRAAPGARAAADFDAGSTGTRRTSGWRAPTTTPNQGVLANLTTLRDRSRATTRNNGYGKGTIDKLVTNIIGTGIQPEPQGPADFIVPHPVTGQPAPWRAAVKALWYLWTDQSDADGQLDWYGQQTQAVRCWLEGGEAFVRERPRFLSDRLAVPLQIQVLEPELCPHGHTVQHATQRVRAGIEFDALGRRVAYWFHPSRPESDDFDATQLRRIGAPSVVHLYDPLRAGQLRGLPHLTQALVTLHELDKFSDATLLRQQLANLFVAFLRRPSTMGEAEAIHPLTGTAVTAIQDQPVASLEPGILQELAPGEEVDFSEPPPANGYADFMRQNLYAVAAATGVPYEVITGDMRAVNDRTVRLILLEFRRRIQAWQHQVVVFQLCRRVWRWWMDAVFLSGALPLPASYADNPWPWLATEWKPQGWPYMHPLQDVQAQKAAVRAGFKSRAAVVAEQGDSAEVVDLEQAADAARADQLGLVYDSDPRRTTAAGDLVLEDSSTGAADGTPTPPTP